MPSLEDLSPEQQIQALNLFNFVKTNPEVEKQIRREARKKNPNISAPDLDLEEALEAQKKEFNEKLDAERKERLDAVQSQNRERAHKKIREAGFDPKEVEDVMVNENIGNYDTAIKYLAAQKSTAAPTVNSMTPMSLPDSKDLWNDPKAFMRSTAFDAINELKAKRAAG